MERLQGLELFVAIAELQSFSKAAERFGISKSHASKQLRKLEDRLGMQLLHRTTRRMALTEVGKVFHERCKQILTELEEVELSMGQIQHEPRGLLRVNVPMSFGTRYLAGLFAEFAASYPMLHIDLELSDRRVDVLAEGFDLVLRTGLLEDSTLLVRKIAPVKTFVCASPSYLSQHGEPKHPSELKKHQCLLYQYSTSGNVWSFVGDEGPVQIRVQGRFRTNNGDALREALLHGVGICYLPEFMVCEDLRSGRLKALFPDWQHREIFLWAVYPPSRHLSAKVRLLVDLLLKRFSKHPPWAFQPDALPEASERQKEQSP